MPATEQDLRPDPCRILGNAHHGTAHPPAVHSIVIPPGPVEFNVMQAVREIPAGSLVVLSGHLPRSLVFGMLAVEVSHSAAGALAIQPPYNGHSSDLVHVLWSQHHRYHPGQTFRIPAL